MNRKLSIIFVGLAILSGQPLAAGPTVAAPAGTKLTSPPRALLPTPTLADVPYGPHERQVLDFWKAPSSRPTPLVFYIHGGGWGVGDKSQIALLTKVDEYLAAGISVVSINYRYVPQAYRAGVKPPVQWPLHDAARALQFVRCKAREWNLWKERIGAAGGSAGACSSLWLAFHDDLADPKSDDPVARESTRLWCAAVVGAQTSLDPRQMREWIPNISYGAHAFGIWRAQGASEAFEAFLAQREELLPWINEFSPYALVSADDPPVYLSYSAAPGLGQEQKDPTHSANFGVKLEEKLHSVGVRCELVYPGSSGVHHPQLHNYMIEMLMKPAASQLN